MASLFFTCPTTHLRAPTGIETDLQSLQAASKAMVKVKCPHCGQIHELSVRETYIMARCRMLSAGSLPRLSGSFDDGKNRVMIYGPKNVGTNIIEFIAQTGGDDRDTQGRRLSAPRETVPRDGGRV